MSPSVSVIVPCYRYADVLQGCVSSILAQRGVDVRVLIIDDCSPDDTPAVASRLADADARVEYRRNEANLGLIATANEGLDVGRTATTRVDLRRRPVGAGVPATRDDGHGGATRRWAWSTAARCTAHVGQPPPAL